jgi:hypothetical protein
MDDAAVELVDVTKRLGGRTVVDRDAGRRRRCA